MRYKDHDVVIEPNEIEFSHVMQNVVYRQTLHVKNVGNKSKRIEIFRPALKVSQHLYQILVKNLFYFKNFHLIVQNPDQPVPPGLEVTGVIEYTAKTNQEERDTIVVDVDGQEIQIPIYAFPARPEISVDGKSENYSISY